MPSVGDILETSVVTRFDTTATLILNVYQHRITSLEPEAGQNILRAWVEAVDQDLVTPQVAIMATIVRVTAISVRNLNNSVEFFDFTYPTPRQGVVASDVLPPFMAWAFIMNRSTAATRNGQKRIAGVPELWQNAGILQTGTTQLNNFAAALRSPVGVTGSTFGDITGIPVIVRKANDGTPLVENPVADAAFRRISTQNTRKR